jgi:hypothetical protein
LAAKQEPNLRWWQRKSVVSGGRAGLEELEHLEASLKLEEVAHFRSALGSVPSLSAF